MRGRLRRAVLTAIGGMLALASLAACGPMPRASRACTWPALLAIDEPDQAPADEELLAPPVRHQVPEVSPAWELVPPPGSGAEDAWMDQRLQPPEARNNHWFVRGMDEFLFDHLEK